MNAHVNDLAKQAATPPRWNVAAPVGVGGRMHGIAIVDDDDRRIAVIDVVTAQNRPEVLPDSIAAVRLIVAAPDLHTAATEARGALLTGIGVTNALDRLDRALARAGGQRPR